MNFHGGLLIGAGTTTGHVIVYDIRSSKPLIVKDHMNGLPIKDVVFHKTMDYVYSMDSSILKIWDRNTVSIIILFKKSINPYIVLKFMYFIGQTVY